MRALWRPPARPDEPLFDAAFRRRLEQLALRTRLGEVSTELTAHVLVDTSASMNWGDPNKLWHARRLAAALGYVTLWHFDRLVVAPFDTRLRAPFGPRRGRLAA